MKLRISALVAAAALTGCVESALNPDDPVKVAGVALNEDKSPMQNVELTLSRSANNLCLFMQSFAALKTGTDGAYSHDFTGADAQTGDQLARCFEVSLPADPDGARARHDFFVQVQDVAIPTLQRWTGGVTAAQTTDGATVAFKSILDTHEGVSNPTYTFDLVSTENASGVDDWWTQESVTSPVTLSDYVLEDLTTLKAQVDARSETKGSGTTFHTFYGSNKVSVAGHAKRPVSRGVPCTFGGTEAECKLTDGKADKHLAPQNTVEARIQLPTAKVLKKAVFRGFELAQTFKAVIIEGSADGATFTTLAQVVDPQKVKAQYFEVDLTGGAVSVVRVKAVDQSDAPMKLGNFRELSLFE